MLKNKKKGFSFVELVVVIAVMAVLIAVLAPALLSYAEESRMQKDESAMDEVVNSVQLAMADAETFDEVFGYSIPNNYITYTDSSGLYGQKFADEEFWAPDGSANAVTITFNPDENGNYNLSEGIINDMTYGNGSVAQSRTAEGLKQCHLDEMGNSNLYAALKQTLGESVSEKSSTYKNSSYTVFVRFDFIDGMYIAEVYGSFNGTNLSEGCPAAVGSGTESYDENTGAAVTTKPGGTQNAVYSNSDLQGFGGSMTPSYKNDSLPCGHHKNEPGDHSQLDCGEYACQCKGNHEIIPAGGKYTAADGTVYNPGDIMPEITTGDAYTYGNYEYRYNQYYDPYTWATNDLQNGWGVKCINGVANPGPILERINGQLIVDMSYTFGWRSSIRDLSDFVIPSGVTNMYRTFYGCTGLKTAPVIPEGVTNIHGAFINCKALTTVPAIPSTVIDLQYAFQQCSSLVTAPDISKAINATEWEGTFYACTKLKNAPTIPSYVTSLYCTFGKCTSLTGTITINATAINNRNLCFDGVDFEAQNLKLSGTSSKLDDIGLRGGGTNYCSDCNGKCDCVLISFIIGRDTYEAKAGMTWNTWLASKYNTDGFIWTNQLAAVTTSDYTRIISPEGGQVHYSRVIQNGEIYRLPGVTPPGRPITFCIDGWEFPAEENMTWADWINSEYNYDDWGQMYYLSDDGYVGVSTTRDGRLDIRFTNSSGPVRSTDTIREGYNYGLQDITPIEFSIKHIGTYQAENGMTWGEWVESDYNTDGFTIVNYGENVYLGGGCMLATPAGDGLVYVNDIIMADSTYNVAI